MLRHNGKVIILPPEKGDRRKLKNGPDNEGTVNGHDSKKCWLHVFDLWINIISPRRSYRMSLRSRGSIKVFLVFLDILLILHIPRKAREHKGRAPVQFECAFNALLLYVMS